jgi:hypothetical protein
MARNKKTPKQAMRYWCVGFNGVVIRARTARVAVRKWLRDNAVNAMVIAECELDNPFGSGEMPGEIIHAERPRGIVGSVKRDIAARQVNSVPVYEVSKRANRSSLHCGFSVRRRPRRDYA